MQVVNDARGSLWRRWDLHVHTPASPSCAVLPQSSVGGYRVTRSRARV